MSLVDPTGNWTRSTVSVADTLFIQSLIGLIWGNHNTLQLFWGPSPSWPLSRKVGKSANCVRLGVNDWLTIVNWSVFANLKRNNSSRNSSKHSMCDLGQYFFQQKTILEFSMFVHWQNIDAKNIRDSRMRILLYQFRKHQLIYIIGLNHLQ